MSSEGPPWFATYPDGSLDPAGVPDRLLSVPSLQQRGILLTEAVHPGIVFRNRTNDGPQYAVKVLDLSREELAIYERLLPTLDSAMNHTVPSEIVEDQHPLLVMPMLHDAIIYVVKRLLLHTVLRVLYELVEVSSLPPPMLMDLCVDNVLVASPNDAIWHKRVTSERVYIIDFNTSRQFALGPGSQCAITLPASQVPKPSGLTDLDPYPWDHHYRTSVRPPWVLRWYSRWLIGEERGCTGNCHCRPTMRTALRVLAVIWSTSLQLLYLLPLERTFSNTLKTAFCIH
ncbi:hypothetical protein BC628DRAFT_1412795 [Trametes gibbosa]|nr:hypothetical protein BC628DRAFT_1412795 [Trametes gibbosa]